MRKIIILSVLFLLQNSILPAQIKIVIDKVPSNTKLDDMLFIAGNFNSWNPSNCPLKKNEKGQYVYILNTSLKNIEFKITRGNWQSVETDINGNDIKNRTFKPKNKNTIFISVEAWKDSFDSDKKRKTAAENVIIFNSELYSPQLKRNRRIWVYLPPDYATSDKKYPVLYMHDGQNLFSEETSFSGEWGIDESLNKIFSEQNYKTSIIVGIDNGENKRIEELTPWKNPKYDSGNADNYLSFIVETIKPKIDSAFRTFPDPENTAIGGSSLGGLVSVYAGLKYNSVFSKLLVFSPAFWVNDTEIFNYTEQNNFADSAKIYIVSGGNEGKQIVSGTKKIDKILKLKGFSEKNLNVRIVPGGMHNEQFWRAEFPAAFMWLFQ